jgi:hypothetical protein
MKLLEINNKIASNNKTSKSIVSAQIYGILEEKTGKIKK